MGLATKVSLSDTQQTRESCERLAAHLQSLDELPVSCRNYGEIVSQLRHRRRRSIDNAFDGMPAGAAAAARKAAAGEFESHAHIQRRLTTGRRFSKK